MASALPRAILKLRYADAAQEYLRNLPPEHFMEAIGQSTQRKITVESLDLVTAVRPEVQVFSELLVQYPRPGEDRPGQIVPDNMVVLCDQPIKADGSFDVPLQPARPFWVLEYVSKHNKRKDYEQSFDKYEQELRVPYYLIFYPDDQELTLYQLKAGKYVSVKPNRQGRYPIRKLGLEMALLDGWVRFWHEGRLLPLPADLQRELDEANRRADAEQRRADDAARRAEELEQRLRAEAEARRAVEEELARLRAQVGRPSRRGNPSRPG